MADLDCRIIAMFALALSLLFLGGVTFFRHHNHHNPGAEHRTSEALVAERDCSLCDCNDDTTARTASNEDSAEGTNLIATPCASNKTSTTTVDSGFRISEICLQCVCEMTTECKPSVCGGGEMCGIFMISHSYWVDAGRPKLDTGAPDTVDDSKREYLVCVNNPFCAARTVNAYIQRYSRDCDEDGVIDCYDYAAIHMLGPTGCMEDGINSRSYHRLRRCLEMF